MKTKTNEDNESEAASEQTTLEGVFKPYTVGLLDYDAGDDTQTWHQVVAVDSWQAVLKAVEIDADLAGPACALQYVNERSMGYTVFEGHLVRCSPPQPFEYWTHLLPRIRLAKAKEKLTAAQNAMVSLNTLTAPLKAAGLSLGLFAQLEEECRELVASQQREVDGLIGSNNANADEAERERARYEEMEKSERDFVPDPQASVRKLDRSQHGSPN